jgi:hypothetical protein
LAIRELTGGSCGLIVIDTLSRALAGGDENSSTDMGALVKNVDALRAATGAHLLVVHHSGKNKANGARGHSLLRAATDTEIEIEAGLIAVTKQRDLDKSWSSGFVLEEHILGEDEDGDYIKSCTVKLVSAASVQVGLAPGEQNVLEAVAALAASTPGPHKGVKSREIGSYMGDKGGGYRKVLARLVDKGHVIKDENGLYFVK